MPFKKIKEWFINQPLFKKLLKNASKLLSGDLVASVLSLVTVAITARGLGPESYGILVLIQAYVGVVDKLVNFQSWEALIKYGAEALENDNVQGFKKLIKFGTLLDAGSAILGVLVAILGAYVVGIWQSWSTETILMIMVYSSTILFNLVGTPIAILRLFDKFGLFAVQKIFTVLIKVGGVLVAYTLGVGLWGFLLVYVITIISGYLILFTMGWRELKAHEISGVFKTKTKNLTKSFNGLWSYVWTTNFSGSVRMASRRIDTIVVGALLGAAATGVYEVAKKIATVVNRLSDPLYQAIYPELAKLWSQDKKRELISLSVQSSCFVGFVALIIWVVFIFLGDWVILISVGSEYSNAYPVLTWYLLAIIVEIFAFPLQPIMLAMGHPKKTFYVHIFTTVLYFAILYPLLLHLGLIGAGIAYLIYYIIWTLIMVYLEFKMLKS